MPTIYLFFMILGQLGTWLTAWLAYEYEWQYVYYFMMATMLASILIIFVTMPFERYQQKRFPITFSKFGNVVIFSIMMCSFIYIMVYGKTYDWFAHESIRIATANGWAARSSIWSADWDSGTWQKFSAFCWS